MKQSTNIKENEYKISELPRNVIEHLKISEEEISRGEGIEAEVAFKELRKKYGY